LPDQRIGEREDLSGVDGSVSASSYPVHAGIKDGFAQRGRVRTEAVAFEASFRRQSNRAARLVWYFFPGFTSARLRRAARMRPCSYTTAPATIVASARRGNVDPSNGVVPTLRVEEPRIDRPRPFGEHGHVADTADRQRSTRTPRIRAGLMLCSSIIRASGTSGSAAAYAPSAISSPLEADRRVAEQLGLLVEAVRCVIGREDVDRAVAHGGKQRFAVALGPQRRIDLRISPIAVEAVVEQQQVMGRHLAGWPARRGCAPSG